MASEAATLRIALLAGGVSRQGPESRSRSQVETADNIDISLTHGSSRRNGSRHLAVLSGVDTAYNHWLTRCQLAGGDDVLVNTDSNGGVRVYDRATLAAKTVIDITSPTTDYFSTSTYLSLGAPSRHPLAVVGDDIILSNPNVAMAATASPSVTTTAQRDNYDALEPFTGTAGRVYRAKASGVARGPGLYRYIPGIGTYATAQFAEYNASDSTIGNPQELFTRFSQNPRGFRLFYSKFIHTGSVSYGTTTVAGTTVGVLSGLPAGISVHTHSAGDQVYVDNTGGATAGAYTIRSISGTTVTLATTIAGAGANVTMHGIGRMVEITENFATDPIDSMDDAAVRYTKALRDAGLTNACVQWDWTDFTTYKGKFTITAGDGGPVSGFSHASHTVFAPTGTGVYNDSGAGGAFNGPTLTAGTGAYETFTTVPRDRWVPVPAPDQPDAILDPKRMPVRLRKVDTTGYDETTLDLGAWHYWRLGDSTVNDTAKDSAAHSIGAYVNTPTRGVTGLVTGDTNTATTFASASSEYVSATTWWAIGNRERITLELLLRTSVGLTAASCLFHMKQASDIYVTLNEGSTNNIRVYAGGGQYDATVANFNDGAIKHLVVTMTATGMGVHVNGTGAFGLLTTPPTTNPGIGAEEGGYTVNIGRRIDGTQHFNGTMDEVALYPFAFTSALAAYRYAQVGGVNADLWVIDEIPWAARLSGDSASNLLPNLVKNGSPVLSLASWQSRFALGGERFVLMSGTNDPYRFFIANTDLVADSDPIERPCGSAKTARVTQLAPYRKVMVAFTDQGEQYEVAFAGDALTPSTSSVDLSTAYDALDTPPVTMGDRLYFAARDGTGTQVIEYVIDDLSVAGTGERIGQHVEGYITASDIILAASPNDGVLSVLGRNSATRWRYFTAYVNDEPRARAWTKADASADEVLAACQVGGDLYTIVRRGTDYALEAVQIVYEAAGASTYQPRMDGRVAATGVFSTPTTTWAVPAGVTAAGITHAVKSDGTTVAVTVAGSNVTATGNYAGAYTLGRAYTHTLTLSRLFLRDGNDAPYTSIGLRLRQVTARLRNTMYAALSYVLGPRAAITKTKTATTPSSLTLEAWVPGDADRTVVSFTAADPRPFSVGAVDIEFDAIPERQ
jgi:hypothetical protein